jgi:hypothetical protein
VGPHKYEWLPHQQDRKRLSEVAHERPRRSRIGGPVAYPDGWAAGAATLECHEWFYESRGVNPPGYSPESTGSCASRSVVRVPVLSFPPWPFLMVNGEADTPKTPPPCSNLLFKQDVLKL